MKKLLVLVYLLFFAGSSQAAVNTFALDSAYLIQPSKEVQFDDVLALPNDKFKPFTNDLRLGFVEESVWIKLRITPKTVSTVEPPFAAVADSAAVLRMGLLSIDRIELYEKVGGRWIKQIRGDTVPQKYAGCQDDHHCFELASDPKHPIDLYLKVQTTTLLTVVLQAVSVRDLSAVVADRMVSLVSTFSVAVALLVMGLLFFIIDRSHLVATFCAYQFSVVLLTFLTTGFVSRVFEHTSAEQINLITQYLQNFRAMFTVLLGYVLLRPFKLPPIYHQAMWLLAGLGVVSFYFVFTNQFFNAIRLNILIHLIGFSVQILGVLAAEKIPKLLRWITLLGYSVFAIILLGSIVVNFNLFIEISSPAPLFMQSFGDSRLNGGRVGIFLFAILIIQVFERRKINSDTLQEFKIEAAKSTAQRERLMERQSMIDMLTHELKNPLGTIRFALASLKRSSADDSDSQQRVKRIDDSVERMNELIEHVALSNKIDRFDVSQVKESVDVEELVDVCIGDFEDISIFKLDIAKDLDIQTSRLMLTLIFQNLISNAYKYHLKTDSILIRAYRQDSTVVVEVSNTVELEKSPDPSKIFQAYYRHDYVQDQSGMGLGLSLVLAASEKINASINFVQHQNLVVFSLKVPQ
jgi:signal transduction histidine kinase